MYLFDIKSLDPLLRFMVSFCYYGFSGALRTSEVDRIGFAVYILYKFI